MTDPLPDSGGYGSPLESISLREQALRVIRGRIVAGELRPGELHSLGAVAEQLGVSVTPVREAVLDLAREGLVVLARNRGFRVKEMTERDLDELAELRRMIEVDAVRQIAARGLVKDPTALRALAAQSDELAARGDWGPWLANDREFHLGLLAHLGNSRLITLVGSLRDQSRLYGLDRVAGTEALARSTHEHTLLLDAIVAGRAEEAAGIMLQHLQHARGIWAGKAEPGSV